MLLVGWAAVAAVPLVSALRMAADGWVPGGDAAVITALTVDSWSTDPPLLGMPTSLGFEGGVPLHHPGPLGFWAMSVPTLVAGPPGRGILLGAAALASASIALVAHLARRHRRPGLEAAVLVLTAALVGSIGGDRLADPLNPYTGLVPSLAFVVGAWNVASGRHRDLWAVVLAGSFAAQVHLSYAVLVSGLSLLVAASFAVDALRSDTAGRRTIARSAAVAGAVGLLAWAAPLVDQVAGRGNLLNLLGAGAGGERPTLGLGHGLAVMVEMTSVPPGWWGRATDLDVAGPSALRIALSCCALSAAAAATVLAVRRRDRTSAALGATALSGVVLALVSSSRVMRAPFADEWIIYRLFWWPVGLLLVLAIAVGSAMAFTRAPRARALRGHAGSLSVAGVVLAVAVAAPGYRSHDPELMQMFEGPVAQAELIASMPSHPDSVVLHVDDRTSGDFGVRALAPGLIAQLRLRGIEVRFPRGSQRRDILHAYRADHPATGDEDLSVLLRMAPAVDLEPPPGYDLLVGSTGGSVDHLLATPTAVFVGPPSRSPEAVRP